MIYDQSLWEGIEPTTLTLVFYFILLSCFIFLIILFILFLLLLFYIFLNIVLYFKSILLI